MPPLCPPFFCPRCSLGIPSLRCYFSLQQLRLLGFSLFDFPCPQLTESCKLRLKRDWEASGSQQVIKYY